MLYHTMSLFLRSNATVGVNNIAVQPEMLQKRPQLWLWAKWTIWPVYGLVQTVPYWMASEAVYIPEFAMSVLMRLLKSSTMANSVRGLSALLLDGFRHQVALGRGGFFVLLPLSAWRQASTKSTGLQETTLQQSAMSSALLWAHFTSASLTTAIERNRATNQFDFSVYTCTQDSCSPDPVVSSLLASVLVSPTRSDHQ